MQLSLCIAYLSWSWAFKHSKHICKTIHGAQGRFQNVFLCLPNKFSSGKGTHGLDSYICLGLTFFFLFFFLKGLFKTHLYNNFQHNKYFKRLINSRKKINVHNGKLIIFFFFETDQFIHSFICKRS